MFRMTEFPSPKPRRKFFCVFISCMCVYGLTFVCVANNNHFEEREKIVKMFGKQKKEPFFFL